MQKQRSLLELLNIIMNDKMPDIPDNIRLYVTDSIIEVTKDLLESQQKLIEPMEKRLRILEDQSNQQLGAKASADRWIKYSVAVIAILQFIILLKGWGK